MRVRVQLLMDVADKENPRKLIDGRGYTWSGVYGLLGRDDSIMVQSQAFRRCGCRLWDLCRAGREPVVRFCLCDPTVRRGFVNVADGVKIGLGAGRKCRSGEKGSRIGDRCGLADHYFGGTSA